MKLTYLQSLANASYILATTGELDPTGFYDSIECNYDEDEIFERFGISLAQYALEVLKAAKNELWNEVSL